MNYLQAYLMNNFSIHTKIYHTHCDKNPPKRKPRYGYLNMGPYRKKSAICMHKIGAPSYTFITWLFILAFLYCVNIYQKHLKLLGWECLRTRNGDTKSKHFA